MPEQLRVWNEVERVLALGGLPGFAELDGDQIAATAAAVQERFVHRGQRLSSFGEPVTAVWAVVEGELRVDGDGIGEHRVGPREGAGFLSLLARAPRGLAIVAEEDTHVLELDYETIREAFEEDFTLYVHWTRSIAARTLEIRQRTPSGSFLAVAAAQFPGPDESLGLVERIEVLRRTPLGDLSLDATADFAAGMQEVRFEPGSILWRSGERSGFEYILLSGTVRCTLPEGRSEFICGPGCLLGDLESQGLAPRWFEARAETPVRALRGETEALLDILEDHFPAAMDLLAARARHLLELLEADKEPA